MTLYKCKPLNAYFSEQNYDASPCRTLEFTGWPQFGQSALNDLLADFMRRIYV